jgi:hypothetical protein
MQTRLQRQKTTTSQTCRTGILTLEAGPARSRKVLNETLAAELGRRRNEAATFRVRFGMLRRRR